MKWYSTIEWFGLCRDVAWRGKPSKILFIWAWPFFAIILAIAAMEDITSNLHSGV